MFLSLSKAVVAKFAANSVVYALIHTRSERIFYAQFHDSSYNIM